MGGHWTLRDIVDYEMIATMALLETAADRRETILRQIYEVNRQTIEDGKKGNPSAILVPVEHQQDAREAAHLVDKLNMGGVEIYRADAPFDADGKSYSAGTFVIPMTQVFARYAKDMLEKQTYPEVRRSPTSAPEPPYDVTAWSLGMLLGVDTVFVKNALPAVKMSKVDGLPKVAGDVTGSGTQFGFDYKGPDTAIAINRLLKDGARLSFDDPSHVAVSGIARTKVEAVAREFGLTVKASADSKTSNAERRTPNVVLHAPRVGMYQPWTGGNIDEGWTRWVLEQYRVQPDADSQRRHPRRQAAAAVRRDHPRRSDAARDRRRLRRASDSPGVSRRHRRGRRRQTEAVHRRRRHADHAWATRATWRSNSCRFPCAI